EWISDKTRFVWDGLGAQRLDRPYVRKGGKLQPASWDEAFKAIAKSVKGTDAGKIGAIAGDLAAVEDMYALKGLMTSLGSTNMDCREPGSVLDPKNGRASYLFNATIDGIEASDALLIIGSNPRFEASVLNARIRKRSRMSDYPVALIGEAVDLRYPHEHLGTTGDALADLVSGKNKFAAKLKKAKNPLILIGQGALNRKDSQAIMALAAQVAIDCKALREDWNGFSVLHNAAGRVGGLDIGFVPGKGGKDSAAMLSGMEVLFLLGVDEIDMGKVKGFTVYIGTHGDAGAHRADVILPASAYTEKSATYVNTEGRVQMTNRAAFAPGQAREDWAIFRALSAVLGEKLPFDSLQQLRARLHGEFPHLARFDEVAPGNVADVKALASKTGKIGAGALVSPVADFYLTNPIARSSKVMAECSQMFSAKLSEAAE
ncbi:MAG: molybdopterin-dependent oxidoreductase, partial [Nitratireductor sp.]|nr:molybdopterin-dependent oxidoreductase [Nitratireductor sp.]